MNLVRRIGRLALRSTMVVVLLITLLIAYIGNAVGFIAGHALAIVLGSVLVLAASCLVTWAIVVVGGLRLRDADGSGRTWSILVPVAMLLTRLVEGAVMNAWPSRLGVPYEPYNDRLSPTTALIVQRRLLDAGMTVSQVVIYRLAQAQVTVRIAFPEPPDDGVRSVASAEVGRLFGRYGVPVQVFIAAAPV